MEEDEKKEIFQSPPEYQNRLSRSGSTSSAKRYIIAIIFVIVIALIILGIFKFFNGSNNKIDITPTPTLEVLPTDTPTPTETISGTPSPTEKPSATPKPSVNPIDKASGLNRSKLSVHVLNGSGVAGASRKASDLLEGLGYNVVQLGNADNFDYAQTEIKIKSAKSEFLPLLKKDLSTNYTIGNTSGDPGASESADAVVIVGKE